MSKVSSLSLLFYGRRWKRLAAVAAFSVCGHSCHSFTSRTIAAATSSRTAQNRLTHSSPRNNGYVSPIKSTVRSLQSISQDAGPVREAWTKLPRLRIGPEPSPVELSTLNSSLSQSLSSLLNPQDRPTHFGQDMLVPLSVEQSHYLTTVLRLKKKAKSTPLVRLFDGKEEWVCEIVNPGSKSDLMAKCVEQIRCTDEAISSCWIFVAAPKKKDRSKWLVEKCTELSAAGFCFLDTDYSEIPEKFSKLILYAAEATEQSERFQVPHFVHLASTTDADSQIITGKKKKDPGLTTPLTSLLETWASDPSPFSLLVCRERHGQASSALEVLQSLVESNKLVGPVAFLIGPEGGWSTAEEKTFNTMQDNYPELFFNVALGPNILRTETAAAAAVTMHSIVSSTASKS